MNKKVKTKPIAAQVAINILMILVLMCICLSIGIQNAFHREFEIAEVKYMTEVIARLSLEVNNELNHYIDAAKSTANSKTIQEYLYNVEHQVAKGSVSVPTEQDVPQVTEEISPDIPEMAEEQDIFDGSEDSVITSEQEGEDGVDTLFQGSEPLISQALSTSSKLAFHEVEGYDSALAEIKDMAQLLGNSVVFVAICSIYQDNFFNNQEYSGGDSFTLSTRPFYPAYSTQQTYITDLYEEAMTGIDIITIAEPMFDTQGKITGLLLVQLSFDFVSNLVTSATFGETGASMLIDRNHNVIAYSTPSVIGMNISQLSYSGEGVDQELANPTGTILDYSFAGVERTGGIVKVSELSGWKMLLAMDESEFKSNISVVAFRLNVGLTVAVILCACLCAKSVFRHLAPMKKLEEFMEELAQGNLSGSVDYDEPNEIGRLAYHMNLTAKSLATYIDMIDRAMKGLADGDLTRPDNIHFKGDFKSIEASIETFVLSMSDSLHEIKQSMEQMNQGAEQVASGAQLLSNGSSEQTNSVEGLNALISAINDTIVVTAKNSSTVTTDAKKISDNLVESNQKMQELVVSVQDIRAMSDEVKRIIKTIEDVAFQTNILSLNASVEAARAGTSGRGFAVVADEVRNLSFKTAEAAEETNKIINDIANAIETGTELAQTTSTELQAVVDDVDIFVDNISNISLSAQDQAEAIAEINRGIDEISRVVVQNSAISEESAASSEELSAQSDQMLSLVEGYKLVK